MGKKFRVGIIGCGGIANGKHMPALKNTGRVDMVAFCDIIEERAVKAAQEYGTPDAKVYTDYKELLKDDSIEIVHVCTPNRSHSFITIDALEAGKHVMCEKPMAKTYEEAKAMVEAAKRTGKKLTIGYQNRQKPQSLYVKECCDNGELGEIYYARAIALRRRAVPTWGVFLNEYEQGGGPLIDIATHALDMTLWMMNNYEPKMVVGNIFKKLGKQRNTANAWGDWDPEQFTVEDSAFGYVVMKNGAVISVESSWALNIADPDEANVLLCGDKAGADTLHDKVRINYVKNNRQVIECPDFSAGGVAFYDGKKVSPKDLEAQKWLDAIEFDTDPCVTPEQALVVTQILEAIYTSAKTGQPVFFE
ncbi:MAG TPA: Gfo/Idh/MocA family oxidoreductase [Clostridiales bacterium]|jgi:predicted dehydrogenase|nr:Gfo/Idh/MocA family oxidoreductase [Clostridiales bacterium]HPU67756.1 Gfo/Idh/MocA family oxidoreductase [Clostridiales bacterium]HXK83321.1 Gfo/Idh/MocA family oxidoreductase [Clostridiales bacterium]